MGGKKLWLASAGVGALMAGLMSAAPAGAVGILVQSISSPITITINSGTIVNGGVVAKTGGSGTITLTNNGTVNNNPGTAIILTADLGAINVANNGTINGEAGGLLAVNSSPNGVSFTDSGTVTSSNGFGMEAVDQAGGTALITTASGTASSQVTTVAGTTGIVAQSGTGAAQVNLGGYNTVAAGAPGEVRIADVAAIALDTESNPGGQPAATVNVGSNDSFALQGNNSAAISAQTGTAGGGGPNGSASAVVNVGAGVNVHVSGLSNAGVIGFVADPSGAATYGGFGNVTVNVGAGAVLVDEVGATGPLTGAATSSGEAAISAGGNVTINNQAQVTVTGGESASLGLVATTSGAGASVVVTNASVTSGNGDAIRSTTQNGNNAVVVGFGQVVATNGDGVDATASGAGAVVVNTNAGTDVSTTTPGSFYGVYATSALGSVTVSANGTVSNGGVFASAGGAGSVTIDANGAVTNAGGEGIAASAVSGPITIITTAPVTAASSGIVAQASGAAPVVINVDQNITALGALGIQAFDSGSGNAVVTLSGPLVVADPSLVGVEAGSFYGSATVVMQDNETVVAGSPGVVGGAGVVALSVLGTSGAEVVNLGSNDSIAFQGDGSAAITAHTGAPGLIGPNGSASAVINAGAGLTVHVSGYSDSGVIGFVADPSGKGVYGGDGNVAVTVAGGSILVDEVGATGSPTGTDTSTGEAAISYGGKVVINNAAQVTVTGGVSTSVGLLTSTAGTGTSTIVSTGSVTSGNGDGIRATTANGGNVVTVQSGQVLATGGDGVNAVATGAGPVTVSTAAGTTVLSTTGAGISAASGSGNVTVTTNGVVADGGVSASTGGAGAVTVTTNAAVTDTHGGGVSALAAQGPVTIVDDGVVTASGNGVVGQNNGSSPVSIVVEQNVQAGGALGVQAFNQGAGSASVIVAVGANVTGPSLVGVEAGSLTGPASVTLKGDNTVIAGAPGEVGGAAVVALSLLAPSGPAASVNLGVNDSIAFQGNGSAGVTAHTGFPATIGPNGSASAAITAGNGLNVHVSGYSDSGVIGFVADPSGAGVYGGDGNVTVTVGTGTVTVDEIGATGSPTGTDTSTGVAAISYGGNVLIDNAALVTVTGGVSTSVGLLTSTNAGGGASLVNSRANVVSEHGDGIRTTTANGANIVNILAGSVVAIGGDGVNAVATGAGPVTVNVTAATTVVATTGVGVSATSGAGNVIIVDNGTIGDGGVAASAGGSGTVSVTTNGAVTDTHGDGIRATTDNGADTVAIQTGLVVAAGGDGVDASSTGAGNITVTTAAGTTVVATTGVGLSAAGGSGNVTVVNNGTVGDGGVAASTGGSGAVTVTSNGAVTDTHGGGISATAAQGSATITDNALVTASGAGVVGQSSGFAATTVTINQSVVAGGGDAAESENGGVGAAVVTIAGGTSKAPLSLTNSGGAGAIAVGILGPAKVTLGNYDTITTANTLAGASGVVAIALLDSGNPVGADAASVVTGAHDTITVSGNDDSAIAALVGLAGTIGPNGSAGASIQTGAGLAAHVSGFNASGLFAATTDYSGAGKYVGGGSATVSVGTGSILVDEVGAMGAPTGNRISVGVGAVSGYGNVSIDDSAQVTVTGGQDISIGLDADTGGSGDSVINARAAVTTGNGDAIQSTTLNGANTVTVFAGKIAATGGDGIDAHAYGSGAVTVTTLAGTDVRTLTPGDFSGITAASGFGNVTVVTQDTVSDGGIAALTGGNGVVNVQTNASVTDTAGDGIGADSGDGADTITVNAGKVTATGGDGIDAHAGASGSIVVTAAAGTTIKTLTPGAFYGISAVAGSGNVAVVSQGNVTDGGIIAVTGNGQIAVDTAGTVTDTAGAGITTVTGNGADNILVSSGKVTATGGDGIQAASGGGNINIATLAGTTVKTLSAGVFQGIQATSGSGFINIAVNGDVTDGGIVAATGGAGQVAIATSGSVTNSAGDGIDGAAATGSVAIATQGAVSATGRGVYAHASGFSAAPVTVNVSGSVKAGTGIAVEAEGDGFGSATATTAAGTAGSPLTITSTGASGVGSFSFAGPANTTVGGYNTITAGAPGLSAIAAVFAINEAALFGPAPAQAVVSAGDILTAKGNASAGVAAENEFNGGTGSVSAVIADGATITVKGLDVAGVIATTTDPLFEGRWTGTGTATAIVGADTITVNESGATGSSTGTMNNIGVAAFSGGGNVTVSSAATITVSGGVDTSTGIDTFTSGSGASLINESGSITSKQGDGIRASTVNGMNTVTLLGGSVTANNGAGVNAVATGSGVVKVTVGAGVSVSGMDGVTASTNTGLLVMSNSGTITAGGGGVGVLFSSQGPMVLDNQAGAVITGAGSSIAVEAGGGALFNLANQGSLGGTKLQNNGMAIDIAGPGGLVLDNAAGANLDGDITADNNVAFTNEGTWATRGTSNFGTAAGAASNSLTNTGLIQVGDNAPASAGVASEFDNLGAFHNGTPTATGTISMINGHVGDVLTMNAPFIAATGHSDLGLDAALGGPGSKADELVLTQGSSGQTLIDINNAIPGQGALNAKGIIVVTGQTHDSDFALDPSQANYDPATKGIDSGLFTYVLNDVKGNEALVGVPGLPAVQLAAMGGAVAQVWSSTTPGSDMEVGLMADFVGGGDQAAPTGGLHVWAKALNWGASRLNGGQTQFGASFATPTDVGQPVAALSGVASGNTQVSSGAVNLNLNAGYAQNTSSLTTGVDLMRHLGQTSAWAFGVSGGYVESEQSFATGSAPALYSGAMATAQGSYIRGGFYLDGDFKVDVLRASFLGDWQGATRQGSTAASFGAEADAGYHLALSNNWTFEPLTSLSMERTSMSGMTLAGEQVSFPDADSLKASVGARLAADYSLRGYRITGSATARVWDEFGSQNGLLFDGVASGLVPFGPGSGALGDMSAQVNVANLNERTSAFVGAAYQFNATYKAESVLAGFKLRW